LGALNERQPHRDGPAQDEPTPLPRSASIASRPAGDRIGFQRRRPFP
jgi:hypothetical protein